MSPLQEHQLPRLASIFVSQTAPIPTPISRYAYEHKVGNSFRLKCNKFVLCDVWGIISLQFHTKSSAAEELGQWVTGSLGQSAVNRPVNDSRRSLVVLSPCLSRKTPRSISSSTTVSAWTAAAMSYEHQHSRRECQQRHQQYHYYISSSCKYDRRRQRVCACNDDTRRSNNYNTSQLRRQRSACHGRALPDSGGAVCRGASASRCQRLPPLQVTQSTTSLPGCAAAGRAHVQVESVLSLTLLG